MIKIIVDEEMVKQAYNKAISEHQQIVVKANKIVSEIPDISDSLKQDIAGKLIAEYAFEVDKTISIISPFLKEVEVPDEETE